MDDRGASFELGICGPAIALDGSMSEAVWEVPKYGFWADVWMDRA